MVTQTREKRITGSCRSGAEFPFQRRRQYFGRIVDAQGAAAGPASGCAGAMKDKRAGGEDVATFRNAGFAGGFHGNALSLIRCNNSERMSARRDVEASVCSVGRIEVDTQEQHALEKADRRLDMPDAGFA